MAKSLGGGPATIVSEAQCNLREDERHVLDDRTVAVVLTRLDACVRVDALCNTGADGRQDISEEGKKCVRRISEGVSNGLVVRRVMGRDERERTREQRRENRRPSERTLRHGTAQESLCSEKKSEIAETYFPAQSGGAPRPVQTDSMPRAREETVPSTASGKLDFNHA